jgi:hypothetical protein
VKTSPDKEEEPDTASRQWSADFAARIAGSTWFSSRVAASLVCSCRFLSFQTSAASWSCWLAAMRAHARFASRRSLARSSSLDTLQYHPVGVCANHNLRLAHEPLPKSKRAGMEERRSGKVREGRKEEEERKTGPDPIVQEALAVLHRDLSAASTMAQRLCQTIQGLRAHPPSNQQLAHLQTIQTGLGALATTCTEGQRLTFACARKLCGPRAAAAVCPGAARPEPPVSVQRDSKHAHEYRAQELLYALHRQLEQLQNLALRAANLEGTRSTSVRELAHAQTTDKKHERIIHSHSLSPRRARTTWGGFNADTSFKSGTRAGVWGGRTGWGLEGGEKEGGVLGGVGDVGGGGEGGGGEWFTGGGRGAGGGRGEEDGVGVESTVEEVAGEMERVVKVSTF